MNGFITRKKRLKERNRIKIYIKKNEKKYLIEIIKHRRKHRRRIFFNVVKHKGTMIWESMTLMSLGYFFKNYINFFIWYLQDIKNGKNSSVHLAWFHHVLTWQSTCPLLTPRLHTCPHHRLHVIAAHLVVSADQAFLCCTHSLCTL